LSCGKPQSSYMRHRLTVINPDGGRRTVRLDDHQQFTLGRSGGNNLSYPADSGLSRHHLIMERVGQDWWIRDLGSKNGTILNDERITEKVRLRPGDRVTVSHVVLIFDDPNDELSEGTVIFDPVKPESKKVTTTHTVTLRRLLSEDQEELSAKLKAQGGQWTDPVTALVRAGRELVANKPVKELFRDILDLSLEAVGASRGVLLTLEGDELLVQASRGDEFRISSAVRDRVIKERSSLLISDALSDDMLRGRQSIVLQRVRSLMAVPLQTDDRVLGLIYVDSPNLWSEFTSEHLNLLTVMANVAAMRIERERLAEAELARAAWERELRQAAEIQRQFLPIRVPVVPSLELAGYNCPCHTVGGDYYDFRSYPEGKVMVALGDVAGKGMPAALLMVNLQARVQILAECPGDPAGKVAQLNRAMTEVCPRNRFITFFMCEVDPNSVVDVLEGGGPVLGLLPGLTYQERRCQINAGDVLVIYSDGVTEATNLNGQEFGEERLIDVLMQHKDRSAEETLKAVNLALEEFVASAAPADDITLVVVRRTS
jgi:sigma-B regulation protein RsbU (phosphoserine phosphatase)